MYSKIGEQRAWGTATEPRDEEKQNLLNIVQVFSLWFYSMRVSSFSSLGFCMTFPFLTNKISFSFFFFLLIQYTRVRISLLATKIIFNNAYQKMEAVS